MSRRRLREGMMPLTKMTVVLLPNVRVALGTISHVNASAGRSAKVLEVELRRRELSLIADTENPVDLLGSVPSCLINRVDSLYVVGGMSMTKIKGRVKGRPIRDAGSMQLIDLRALPRGTFASAVGNPRGSTGPLA